MHSRIFDYLDPVALQLFGLEIKWYGLAYLFSALLGYWLLKRYNNHLKPRVAAEQSYDNILIYIVLGVIIGGRLGYVLIYNPIHFISNPVEILKVQQGGMSFHGGLIGVAISSYILCKKYKMPLLAFTDLLACIVPIGLFFGRIANFINSELIGKVTAVPWAVVFPLSDGRTRHPSQLYEALTEGALLFLILNYLFFKVYAKQSHRPEGIISGFFLIFYSFFRFNIEYFREPDSFLGWMFWNLSMGQVLSVICFCIGVSLLYCVSLQLSKKKVNRI